MIACEQNVSHSHTVNGPYTETVPPNTGFGKPQAEAWAYYMGCTRILTDPIVAVGCCSKAEELRLPWTIRMPFSTVRCKGRQQHWLVGQVCLFASVALTTEPPEATAIYGDLSAGRAIVPTAHRRFCCDHARCLPLCTVRVCSRVRCA